MRAEIEVDNEFFSGLFIEDLKFQLSCFESSAVPFFSWGDDKEEERKTRKVKKALKIVSAWYGNTEYTLEELLK